MSFSVMIRLGDSMRYEIVTTDRGVCLGISICDVYHIEHSDIRRIRLYHASYLPKFDNIYYNRNLSLPYDFISYYDGLDISPYPVEMEVLHSFLDYHLMSTFELEHRMGEVRDYAQQVMEENVLGRKIYQYYKKKNKG